MSSNLSWCYCCTCPGPCACLGPRKVKDKEPLIYDQDGIKWAEDKVNSSDHHTCLALALKGLITSDQLESLVFYLRTQGCIDAFEDGEYGRKNKFLNIWSELERKGMIGPGNYGLLERGLRSVQALSHIQIIKEFHAKIENEDGSDEGCIFDKKVVKDSQQLDQLTELYKPLMENGSPGVIFRNAAISLIGDDGGEVKMTNGSVTLEVPPGAVKTDTVFSTIFSPPDEDPEFLLAPANGPTLTESDGIVKYSLPFQLGPSNMEFMAPVLLTIRDFSLPRESAKRMGVYRKTAEDNTWKSVGSCFYDTDSVNNLTARILLNRFSTYVLGLPVLSSLLPLNVHVMVEQLTGTQLKVFFTLNDYTYNEEIIFEKKINVDCATCLYIDPAKDVDVIWIRRAVEGTSSQFATVQATEKVVLQSDRIQNLAEMPVYLSIAEPAIEKKHHEDLLILNQGEEEGPLVEIAFNQSPITPTETDEMAGQCNYTEKDIDDLTSLWDAICICEDNDIDFGELETLDEIQDMLRERLHLRIPTTKRTERKKKFRRFMKTNEKVRRHLGDVYKEIKTFFQLESCGENVISAIDVAIPTCRTQVSRNDELLRRGCRVLVVGESGVGKSSLLNVLIGSPILPIDHLLSCTSTICELVPSDSKDASMEKYRLLGGHQLLEIIKLDTENPKSVQEKLAIYHSLLARDEQENIIRLHWPIPMLPDNVLLVDSPGIGESDYYDKLVTSYLHKTDALIFVINACMGRWILDRRGGPFDPRMSSEMNSLDPGGLTPRSVLFILNKMDQVPQDDRCKLRQWWIKKIKAFWPWIDEEKQVIFISVLQIQKKLKLGLVETEEHWKLLNAIYSLFETCTAAINNRHKRWLSYVYGRIQYLLRLKVTTARIRSEKRLEISTCIMKNLQRTSDEVDLVIKTSGQNFQRKVDGIAAAMIAHLTDETTVEAIAERCLVHGQKTEPFELMDEIRRRCKELIYQAVTKEISVWESNTLLIKNAMSILIDGLRTLMGWSTIDMPEYQTWDHYLFSFLPGLLFPTVDSHLFPKEDMRAAGTLARLFRKFTGRGSTEFREYKHNPRQYMLKLTREAVASLTLENVKAQIIQKDPIELLKTQVPLLREANRKLLHDIEADITISGDPEHRNTELLKSLKASFHHLQYAKLRYPELNETDVYPISEVNMKEVIGRGSIGVVQVASVVLKGEQKPTRIAAKTKGDITLQKADEYVEERDALRLLTHENIVKYIGTSLTQSRRFVVLTELCKCNLSDLIFSHQVPVPGQQNDQVGFLEAFRDMVYRAKQIANGLAYIHRMGDIHGDLHMRNILVTNSGVLKLTDMKQGAITRKEFHLDPNLLHREMSAADVYSLGIVMYELWFGFMVYSDFYTDAIVILLELEDIRRGVRKPTFEVKGFRCPIPEWRQLIEKCWKDTAFERVSSSDVYEELGGKMLSNEFLENQVHLEVSEMVSGHDD